MVEGLDSVHCQVTDMDRAVRFYRDGLGLEPGSLSPEWSDFWLPGGIRLGLHPAYAEGGRGLGQAWVICLAVPDLCALLHRLRAEGWDYETEPHETPRGVFCTVEDPDGNLVQLLQPGLSLPEFRAVEA